MTYLLTTKRLGFRRWADGDLPLAVALWCDPDVMRHMGGAYTEAEAQARWVLEMARDRQFGFQYWPIFLLDTGEHVGCAGLKPFHGGTDVLEVGVHIARRFWSERVGEEAARAAIQFGFDLAGTTALAAGHGPENTASKALIERLGFVFTHEERWGPLQRLHPFYRLERATWTGVSR